MTDDETKMIAEKTERAVADLRARANGRKIFALMSGGVDSSVAVLLALRAGLDVTGATMRQTEDDSSALAAGELCRALGIESLVFDLRREFKERVIEPFKAAYRRGETPNPCAVCNVSVKFGLLWEKIAEGFGGADYYVMTGHYARTARIGVETALLRGLDRGKDQSYFLCMLPRERVERLLLPLGDQTKAETRGMARLLGAPESALRKIAEKPESMEICFLREGDYRADLKAASARGAILNTRGERIGTHGGIENFTIGQRKGLGIASREPLFVTEIRPERNEIVVADRAEAMTREVHAEGVNILTPDAYRRAARLQGKIRSQANPSPCRIDITGETSLTAIFDEAQFAPAPGQYLVLYDGERVVAGGQIRRPCPSAFARAPSLDKNGGSRKIALSQYARSRKMSEATADELEKKLAGVEKSAEEDVAILTERIALLYYAFVKKMTEELGEERAVEITKAAIGEYGAITGRETERRVRELNLAPVVENYAKGKDLPSRGWKKGPLELAAGQPAGKAHRVDFCPFASAWKKLGFERLGRYYCYVDQAKYAAYGRGYRCVHDKNLCDGDDCCIIRVETGELPSG